MYSPFFGFNDSPQPRRNSFFDFYDDPWTQNQQINRLRQQKQEEERLRAIEEMRRRKQLEKMRQQKLKEAAMRKRMEEEQRRLRNQQEQEVEEEEEEEEEEEMEPSVSDSDAEMGETEPQQPVIPPIEPEVAATRIQKVYRGYLIRGIIVPKLKKLQMIEQKIPRLKEQYQPIYTQEETAKKRLKYVLGFEEELLRNLEALDNIISGTSNLVRSRRKELARRLNQMLDELEPLKKQLKEEVKAIELKEAEERQRKKEEEEERRKKEEEEELKKKQEEEMTQQMEIEDIEDEEEVQSEMETKEEDQVEREISPLKDLCYQKMKKVMSAKDLEIAKLKEQVKALQKNQRNCHVQAQQTPQQGTIKIPIS